MDSLKILGILENSKGYDTALMSTFNFEVAFFEKAILSRLVGNNIKKVSVFVDAKELAKAIALSDYSALGKKYAVNPVTMHGSFHPKLILLLGEKKARLILGSGNLKLSGYYFNNEVFNYVDYDAEHQEYRDIVFEAISFFQTLNQDTVHTYGLDKNVFSEIRRYRYFRTAEENGKIFFFHNLREPILFQILNVVDSSVQEMHIAVPYYDKDLAAYHALQDAFVDAQFYLYLQQNKNTFPEEVFGVGNTKSLITVFEEVSFVDEKETSHKNSHFYHGKVFLIKTDTSAYILYGSSNCTQSALLRTIYDGNVECDLMVKGTRNEFDSFFDRFIPADSQEIKSHTMLFEPAGKENYFYMYGEGGTVIKLHIGYHKKQSLVDFFFDDEKLNYYEKEGHIIIEIEEIDAPSFSIQARYGGKIETIICWYNDYRALDLFRMNIQDEMALVDREDYAVGDKFKEEYEKILQAELSCIEDLDEEERIKRAVTTPSDIALNDEAESNEEEDVVVFVDAPDEDIASYQQFQVLEHIRGRIKTRYLNDMSIPSFYRNRGKKHQTWNTDDGDSVSYRRTATTEEKRFERFVKRRVRCYLIDEGKPDQRKRQFIDRLSFDHYFGIAAIFFEIFEKRRFGGELIDDLFIDEYVIPTQIELLTIVIEKSDPTSDNAESVIEFALTTILRNHVLIENLTSPDNKSKLEMKNRSVLIKLEEKYMVRDNYNKCLLWLENGAFTIESQEKYHEAKNYIESLYGYKSIDQIRNYLTEQYGKSSSIVINKTAAKITIFTNQPDNQISKPDETLMREISKYSINVGRLTRVRITIISTDKTSKIEKIEHSIDLEYHKITTQVFRRNGFNSYEKPRFFSI